MFALASARYSRDLSDIKLKVAESNDAMEKKVGELEAKMTGVDDKIDGLDAKMDVLYAKMDQVLRRLEEPRVVTHSNV